MASFESSDPQKSNGKSDSNVRLISLSSEVNFDWSLFDLFLKQHVSQWTNGTLLEIATSCDSCKDHFHQCAEVGASTQQTT